MLAVTYYSFTFYALHLQQTQRLQDLYIKISGNNLADLG